MSRFSGRDEPADSRDEGNPEFAYGDPGNEDMVSVGVRAFLSFSLYVPSAQVNKSRMILVEDSEVVIPGEAEKFIGKDGETGETVEITVRYPR